MPRLTHPHRRSSTHPRPDPDMNETPARALTAEHLVQPLPDPALGIVAAQAAILRLRLAAASKAWKDHDRLSGALATTWANVWDKSLAWVTVVIAEHEIQRGVYAAALTRLLPLESEAEASLRWAVLQTRLHALLACGGDLRYGALKQELDRTATLLEPLLDISATEDSPFSSIEWQERRHRGEILRTLFGG